MDINWEATIGNPAQGEQIYVEQSSPARCFSGRVILVWRNEHDRNVITVVTDNADAEVVNLGPDDRWVIYRASLNIVDVEIGRRCGYCMICHAPLIETSTGLHHVWPWELVS